jgi:hypothetical protein
MKAVGGQSDRRLLRVHPSLGVSELGGQHDQGLRIEGAQLDVERLARDVAADGTPCRAIEGVDPIFAHVMETTRDGDVIVVMSNGAFGGLPRRLADALASGQPSA